MMKVIAYASNQGAFNQIFSLLTLLSNYNISATLFLSHGALNCQPLIHNPSINLKKLDEIDIYFSNEENITNSFALIGLSAYTHTCELYFTTLCQKSSILSICIQDYPGFYGNFNGKVHPDHILIPDNFPMKPKVGFQESIPHIHIPNPFHLLLSCDSNRTSLIRDNIRKIEPRENALFMQPIAISGMLYNFNRFLSLLPTSLRYDVILHPEDYNNKDVFKKIPLLKKKNIRVLDCQIDSLSSLACCRKLVTCYSTVSLQLEDYFFPFPVKCKEVHYLFSGSQIKKSFQASSNLRYPPKLRTIKTYIHKTDTSFNEIFMDNSGFWIDCHQQRNLEDRRTLLETKLKDLLNLER